MSQSCRWKLNSITVPFWCNITCFWTSLSLRAIFDCLLRNSNDESKMKIGEESSRLLRSNLDKDTLSWLSCDTRNNVFRILLAVSEQFLFGLCSHTPNQSRGESVDIYTFKVAKTDDILCNCYTRVIYHQFFYQIKGNYIYYYSLDGYTMKIPSSALNTVIRTSFNNLFPDSCVCFFWNVSSPNCILNTCHPLMLLGV